MKKGWTKYKLGDISDMCLGKMLDQEKNTGEFQPYLANINVRWGAFDFSHLSQMRFEKSEEISYSLKYGDLVICEGGEPGRCALWKDVIPGMKIQKALHRLRVSKEFNNEFVYYRMLLAGKSGELKKHYIGSTIKHLTGIGLKNVEFEFPSLPIQKAIASVLSSLDAKIELNNRINAKLESMAKALYDYWFVQFDFPNAKGKPYKSSGGKMVWNEELKREIPAGWGATQIGKFCRIIRGVTYSKNDVTLPSNPDALPILRATNISNSEIDCDNMVYVTKDLVSKEQILKRFEILITMSSGSRDHIGKNGMFYFDRPVAFGAFCSKIVAASDYRFYTNLFFHSDGFKKHIQNVCLGTNINNLTNDHISGCNILEPNGDIRKNFETFAEPIFSKIGDHIRQNQELIKLRDWLLPMLMNGQVKVE